MNENPMDESPGIIASQARERAHQQEQSGSVDEGKDQETSVP